MSDFFSYHPETLRGDYETPERIFYSVTTEQPFTLATAAPMDLSISPYSLPESFTSHSQLVGDIYPDPVGTAYTTPPPFHSPPLEMLQMDSSTPMGVFFDADNAQLTSGSSTAGSPKPSDLAHYGFPNADGTWRCSYPGCSSRAVFTRGCDLRKHYNRHSKHLFCRYDGCPQATEGGFSSNKDRTRHEAKHNPVILCEWEGCGRVFSRVDNMKDHVRRIHRRRRSR